MHRHFTPSLRSLHQSIVKVSSLIVLMSSSSLSTARFAPIQIGLTGSIGMGKSTISNHFCSMGFSVFDADATVHQLYSPGGEAVPLIRQHYPDVVVDNAIDRGRLSKKVIDPAGGAEVLKLIEDIVHPLVAKKRQEFYEKAAENGELLVLYDIPLLFESRNRYDLDYVIVATASSEVQRQRVMKRPGMTEEKFHAILAKQVSDADKQARADFIVRTDFPGYAEAKAQVASILESIIASKSDVLTSWMQLQLQRKPVPMRSESQPSSIADLFDVVIFDIDDTIVPLMGPINKALAELLSFVEIHLPKSSPEVRASLRDIMIRFDC
jgi:dephospho-CoA kinase